LKVSGHDTTPSGCFLRLFGHPLLFMAFAVAIVRLNECVHPETNHTDHDYRGHAECWRTDEEGYKAHNEKRS
jgi:hypothetical protein